MELQPGSRFWPQVMGNHRFTNHRIHGKKIDPLKQQLPEIGNVGRGDIGTYQTTVDSIAECLSVAVILRKSDSLPTEIWQCIPIEWHFLPMIKHILIGQNWRGIEKLAFSFRRA